MIVFRRVAGKVFQAASVGAGAVLVGGLELESVLGEEIGAHLVPLGGNIAGAEGLVPQSPQIAQQHGQELRFRLPPDGPATQQKDVQQRQALVQRDDG